MISKNTILLVKIEKITSIQGDEYQIRWDEKEKTNDVHQCINFDINELIKWVIESLGW